MVTISQRPIISYQAMQKAARITQYVYQFYFPLHGIPLADIASYYPTLTTIESIIYQADFVMEKYQDLGGELSLCQDYSRQIRELKNSLICLLHELDLYDPVIEDRLLKGEEFIKLENEIMLKAAISHSDIINVAESRSSDVRLLHHILFRMLKKQYDERLISLVWPAEVIADIEDDFKSYADDVSENHYNTYHMFVLLYQEDAPEKINSEIFRYEQMFEERLLQFSSKERAMFSELYHRFRHIHDARIPEPDLSQKLTLQLVG